MTIPEQYKQFCEEGEAIIECPYFFHNSCPSTCAYSKRIMGQDKPQKPRVRLGLERFVNKWGRDWRSRVRK